MSTSAITQQGILGIGPGVGAGMWTRVSRFDVAVAGPTVDGGALCSFTGLSGDIDQRYVIVSRLINGYNGAATLSAQINSDTNSGRYNTLWMTASSANSIASGNSSTYPGISLTVGRALGANSYSEIVIDAKSGVPRVGTGVSYEMSGSSSWSGLELLATSWRDQNSNTDDLIRFDIISSKAYAAAIGSYFELWKLGPGSASAGSSSGGGLTWEIITASSSLLSGSGYFVDATSAPVTLTLPGSPALNMQVGIRVINASNTITLSPNGNRIESSTSDLILNTADAAMTLVYCSNAKGWLIVGLK